MASSDVPCDNIGAETSGCPNSGRFTCKGCFLVSYCGRECQIQDWEAHKKWCKSPLMKSTWKPQWEVEQREPIFLGNHDLTVFGGRKYLWGNVPAIDILQLDQNEGLSHGKDIRLLFAASGDFRNLVQTIASIPAEYGSKIEVNMNDIDFDIVARNAIMLLVAFAIDDAEEAIDMIIHIWYSSLIQESHLNKLKSQIYPLIQDVCEKIQGNAPGALLGKTWTFGARSLRLVVSRTSWMSLLRFFYVPDGLTAIKAHDIRTAVTLAPQRLDYRDRCYSYLPPARRLGIERFRQDGLLLPFGANRDAFTIPNPTIYREAEGWPLRDIADPLDGWDTKTVSGIKRGPASADQYGKLYYHLREILGHFHARVRDVDVSIQLFNVDALTLSRHLPQGAFARVEVSNICDSGYVGPLETLRSFSLFLQSRSENPHATLLMLFMNAVLQSITERDRIVEQQATMKTGMKYLSMRTPPLWPYDPKWITVHLVEAFFRDVDKYFQRYADSWQFNRAGEAYGLVTKKDHTIIEKWPQRLKLRFGETGAQQEFDSLLQSGLSGHERYVEWKRMDG